MHTHIHTHTNAQNGKNTEFCYTRITQNCVNYVGTIRFTELNVKQLANQPCSPPQSPDPSSHKHAEYGVPGVHHKRRPQDMTKIHKIH